MKYCSFLKHLIPYSKHQNACCELHDYHYRAQLYPRSAVDLAFFHCLRQQSLLAALIMYTAVRLFGWTRWNRQKEK